MRLYPYQQKVLECVEADPSHSQLISMPTGTGKTITFLSLAKKLNKKTLILVHREELLNQTYEKAKLCGIKEDEISLVTSAQKQEIKKLTIAMVPTLVRNLQRYSPEDIEAIIIDEAHHATANSYRTILDFFKVFEDKKHLFGFTATPLRGDKSCLSTIFLSHSFKMTLSEATKEGFICPVYGLRVEIDKSLEKIETVQGDYDMKELDRVMNCPEVNKVIVERCIHIKRPPGVIFCTSVDHARTLAKMLRENKKKAISISYLTSKKTLDRIYKMLHRGAIDYITNAVKLSEGFDHPPIQSIIIARPTRSPVLYKQMIGRGLRKSDGKDDCLVVEFTGTDPSMLSWDQIDENHSFQIYTPRQKVSNEEAKSHIKQLFGDKVTILDVRISPFSFYECKMTRLECYKSKFYYMPGKDRFLIFRICDLPMVKGYEKSYRVIVWHCVWNIEMQDYYVWNSGPIFYQHLGYDLKTCLQTIKNFINGQPFGKWYPSEQDMMTPRQRKILGAEIKYSARKAEFVIEDKYYKKLIDTDWINGKYSDYQDVIKRYINDQPCIR